MPTQLESSMSSYGDEQDDILFPLIPIPSSPRDRDARDEWLHNCSDESARQILLSTGPTGVRRSRSGHGIPSSSSDIELVQKANIQSKIIWPWNKYYRIWWHMTALGAGLTVFLAPYQIAFSHTVGSGLEQMLTLLFAIDVMVNFNLAQYKDERIVYEPKQIREGYFKGMFWVDLVGVFPFQRVAMMFVRDYDHRASNDTTFLVISLLRLLRFARLHRMERMSHEFQNNPRVSLLSFTLFRNFAVVVIMCHCQACCMFFLARLNDFGENTWLGPIIDADKETDLERYVTSLYMSITTFCTVGYGDFAPINPAEKIAGSFFMLVNVAIAAWIIGSITLLLLKGDEQTREYRDSLETLQQYGDMHNFDPSLLNKLKDQLRLEFNNREIADESVLKNFPSALWRKILRRLYKEHLINTELMDGIRPQFVDAFLTSCTVEIFTPGDEIVERGSILSDLFLLVGGIAEVAQDKGTYSTQYEEDGTGTKPYDSPMLEAGDLIGEIGFFTESPQIDSVVSLTVCKTLTMSRSIFQLLAHDHPGSVGKILQNLLEKVEKEHEKRTLPIPIQILRAGSIVGYGGTEFNESVFRTTREPLTAVKELVLMHMRKTLDDETTKLLFAASRGDTTTISLMCGQGGFDPNHSDYDNRTALMVASTKGNTDVVRLLLQYNACPNKTDMHGSSALLDATRNGHEDIMDLLFQNGATPCMPESQAASVLCQAAFDGDILFLKRLLKAGIDVNASDYDKRSASHIAAAEGNVAAIRILAYHGADLSLPDRWGNTVEGEARRSNAHQLIAFLEGHKKKQEC